MNNNYTYQYNYQNIINNSFKHKGEPRKLYSLPEHLDLLPIESSEHIRSPKLSFVEAVCQVLLSYVDKHGSEAAYQLDNKTICKTGNFNRGTFSKNFGSVAGIIKCCKAFIFSLAEHYSSRGGTKDILRTLRTYPFIASFSVRMFTPGDWEEAMIPFKEKWTRNPLSGNSTSPGNPENPKTSKNSGNPTPQDIQYKAIVASFRGLLEQYASSAFDWDQVEGIYKQFVAEVHRARSEATPPASTPAQNKFRER